MRKLFASGLPSKFIITLFILAVLAGCVQFSAQCCEISDKVLRLHILANSDSAADQELKLRLRDKILEHSSELLGAPLDKSEAIYSARSRLGDIKSFCNSTLKSLGSDYTADCEVVNMYFNTRTYGERTMPAGFYDALRIKIGKGEGKNWWCVLFPPICLSGAVEERDVFDESDEGVISESEEYEYRFKIVEIFDYLRSLFNRGD